MLRAWRYSSVTVNMLLKPSVLSNSWMDAIDTMYWLHVTEPERCVITGVGTIEETLVVAAHLETSRGPW